MTEDSQVWSSILVTGTLKPVGENWRFWLEGIGRFGNDMSTLSQGMIRPAIGYALNEHGSFWLGYAHVVTDTPFAGTSFDEDRVWQQFLWTQPLGAGTAQSRSRLEQRFADKGSDTGWRLRQLFKLAWPISRVRPLSLVASDEVFVNFDDSDWGPRTGFDQNRAFAGFGYAIGNTLQIEVGYLNQFIAQSTGPDRMTHALAISLMTSIP